MWDPKIVPKSCLLITTAEDRSLAVWTSTPHDGCVQSQDAFVSWKVVYHFHAMEASRILFEARIWRVRVFDWGFATAGEVSKLPFKPSLYLARNLPRPYVPPFPLQDCSLLYCQWPDNGCTESPKPVVLKDIHRGRSIWSLDVRVDSEKSQLQMVNDCNFAILLVYTLYNLFVTFIVIGSCELEMVQQ